jgi:branched-chain amino acid transport system ATP-binding protein
MTGVIECRGLYAGYGAVPVVRDLSLDVAPGEIVALLGSNGAGKTTTLLTIAGVLPVLAGELSVLGAAVRCGKPHLVAARGLSLVPDDRGLFFSLTVQENLRAAGSSGKADTEKVFEYFPSLAPRLRVRAGLLSGGEQQMLALGRALLRRPKALLVDEMSLGLAPVIVERLMPTLRRLADEQGVGILMVEQHVQIALEVADRAYVLRHGELVTEGKAHELASRRELLLESYLGDAALEMAPPEPQAQA